MRAGVQVSSDPPVYEFGDPTDWQLAKSVIEVVPSPPRKQPLACTYLYYRISSKKFGPSNYSAPFTE